MPAVLKLRHFLVVACLDGPAVGGHVRYAKIVGGTLEQELLGRVHVDPQESSGVPCVRAACGMMDTSCFSVFPRPGFLLQRRDASIRIRKLCWGARG